MRASSTAWFARNMLAAAASGATTLKDWAPLIAACVALVGVFIGLWVNGRREDRRRRDERIDAYRSEQRVEIARLLVDLDEYQALLRRHTGYDDERDAMNHKTAFEVLARWESMIQHIRARFTTCSLLVHDDEVTAALDRAIAAFSDSLGPWAEFHDEVREGGQGNYVAPAFDSRGELTALIHHQDNLAQIAKERLAPTIVEEDWRKR